MSESYVDTLETIISAYINTKFEEIPPTEEEFISYARKLRESNKALTPVTDDEFNNILYKLRQTLEIQLDTGIYINDENNGHQSWLPAKRADFEFPYWNRYKRYLEEVKHWNPRVTSNLGKISEEILDLCGDPSEDVFAIKGLVLGDVQSGKTANYTAICNKAADTGYRIIIILAGIQENLRKQTQERLDLEFSGRKSEYFLDPNARNVLKNRSIGVGKYGPKEKIASFTSVTKDFDSAVLRSNNLGIEDVSCPVVLVVKKNKRILNNLINWLSCNNTILDSGKIGLPLLLIDDEADNASVNTKEPDSDPTAINDCIRRLLLLFSKTTYLGITATPFANIFINPEDNEDLFPADFIYVLSAPTNYLSAVRLFGDYGDSRDILIPINIVKLEECIPARHRKTHNVSSLPEDLIEATYYFLLVNAVRDIRGDKSEHRSMMVHISLYTNVQKQIADILREELDQIKSDLGNYAKSSKADTIPTIQKLHHIWDKYGLGKLSNRSWIEVLHKYLYRAVAPIDVREVNMKTGPSSLDYSKHKKDGLRVIAVGGNSLSRGLTLEGLCVSYFHRNTRMYDTLMQMARWLGYRPNYEDLVKIWMSEEAIDWFSQITRATEELKDEITMMRNAHQTPRDFGLKVRQDPGSLIVTARNKMRTATEVRVPISISGNLLETPRLKASIDVLKRNEKVFKDFVNSLATNGDRLYDTERTKGHYYWEHVPSNLVSQLLLDFDTHPWHLSFNGAAISEFINSHNWADGWDVVLIKGGEGVKYPSGIKCGSENIKLDSTEKRKIAIDSRMLSVSGTKVRVGSGGCTRIGLTRNQILDIDNSYKQETGKKNIPDKAYLIENRKPILMLHIIQADYVNDNLQIYPPFLFALGVGFPKDNCGTETANYKINLVELKNMYEMTDAPDEEE